MARAQPLFRLVLLHSLVRFHSCRRCRRSYNMLHMMLRGSWKSRATIEIGAYANTPNYFNRRWLLAAGIVKLALRWHQKRDAS